MALSSLVNSLIHDKFKEYVIEKIIGNNNKIDDKRGCKFSVLPNIASVFADTKFYSISKHYYKYRETR